MRSSPYLAAARAMLTREPNRHEWNWEKVVPAKNCFRFYRIAIEQDLFDGQVIRKYYGRIGSKCRREITVLVSDAESIQRILEQEIKRRLQRQYTLETIGVRYPKSTSTRKAQRVPARHTTLLV